MKCWQCRFLDFTAISIGDMGRCRIHAPAANPGGRAEWPKVLITDDWCAEGLEVGAEEMGARRRHLESTGVLGGGPKVDPFVGRSLI